MEQISGGVCAPKGFKASGIHCGIREGKHKKDIACILSDVEAAAASVYTKNLVKGAPILVTQAHLEDGKARAILCNSGNANTCNANGLDIAREMCRLLGEAAGIASTDVVVASTGVIGQPLPIGPIAKGMPALVSALSYDGSGDAVAAIMTTDLTKKEVAYSFTLEGKECRIGGIAKGSGMIHPNMATMLCFITTDAAISPAMLQKALSQTILDTFNMVSVDGDTSTNDMVTVLANGLAANEEIIGEGESYDGFLKALHAVAAVLCREIARDGEGASRLLTCHVSGGKDINAARTVAKSIVCSSLFKAAMFGADANWGRALCAIGYSGADVDITAVDMFFSSKAGKIAVCKSGAGAPFSEEEAKKVLSENEIDIVIELHDGNACATAWGCDLTYGYVKINGDYRS